MAVEIKRMTTQDSFLEALHSEIVAGTENLASWIKHVQANKGIEKLFEMEMWLKALRSFLDIQHLPLSDTERKDVINRSFAPEIRIVQEVLLECEKCAADILTFGRPDKIQFEKFVENQLRKDSVLEYDVSRIVEQVAPTDSLALLTMCLNDLRTMLGAFQHENQSYQVFVSLGRSYERELKNCRYVDMLLSQRFRLQHDRIDNPVLSGVVRNISEPQLRRNVSLALLYLYRFLRYLRFVARDLERDLPLRRNLVIFSLLHDEMGRFADFLKSRFLKGRAAGHSLWNSVELIVYSLKVDSQRALQRELIFVSNETDPGTIYARIENSHGLLRNCFQGCVITLIQAFDRSFDGRTVFPAIAESLETALQLRQDLWDLRNFLKGLLERKHDLDVSEIIERLTGFREASLRFLMYRDWGEFEHFADALITASGAVEIRTQLRRFVSFLEILVQEVSKRSVLRELPGPADEQRGPNL